MCVLKYCGLMMSDFKVNFMYWYNLFMFMFIVLYKVIILGRKKYLYLFYIGFKIGFL